MGGRKEGKKGGMEGEGRTERRDGEREEGKEGGKEGVMNGGLPLYTLCKGNSCSRTAVVKVNPFPHNDTF